MIFFTERGSLSQPACCGAAAVFVRVGVALLVMLASHAAAQPPGPYSVGELPVPPNVAPPADRGTPQAAGQLVLDVRIAGNETMITDKIISHLRTRPQRVFDPLAVQADKKRLIATGMFREVKVYWQSVPGGIVVTFQVFERPMIRQIRFIGERGISEKKLLRESGLQVGEALNLYAIQEARRKIEGYYHTQGFPKARVTISKGDAPEDREVVFEISEGPLQRIGKVEFIGNTIASDERLKTLIESKPGILWYLFRGKVDDQKIDEDLDKLTAYYRSLGFFGARIGRRKEFDEDQRWMTLQFVIDEGPRYVVDTVSVTGNTRFDTSSLLGDLNLISGDYFDLQAMNRDVNQLQDLYGSQGHIFADITASPRYLIDEPGKLNLVYNIQEGGRFRVGRINVHISGEFPHTRESVVRDRLSLRTGDIVDMREVRASEVRLKRSQLFENNPATGKSPRIEYQLPQLSDADGMISRGSRSSSVRGQSPDR